MPLFSASFAPRSSSRTVVTAEGELDLASAGTLRNVVQEARTGHDDVLLDLSRLAFCDSSGLRLLLNLRSEAAEQGWRLSICIGDGAARRVVEMTRTAALLNVTDAQDATP